MDSSSVLSNVDTEAEFQEEAAMLDNDSDDVTEVSRGHTNAVITDRNHFFRGGF